MKYLNRIISILIVTLVIAGNTACLSPREYCYDHIGADKTDVIVYCGLASYYEQCKIDEELGIHDPGSCNILILACLDMFQSKKECDKETDIPLLKVL
jgi:hypothetical protein